MKRIIILILAIAAAKLVFGQRDNPRVVYHHTISTGLSFTPGFMINGTNNAYISGSLEYYLASRVSVSGECFYFLNSRNKTYPELKMNHQLYTGFKFHILKDRTFDPYIGLDPGFALSQTRANYPLADSADAPVELRDSKIGINPVLAFDAGFNVFAVKYFHLFVNGKYVMGRYVGGPEPYSLNEFMVSFGLGLNVNFWKK